MKALMDDIRFQQGRDSCLYAQEVPTPVKAQKEIGMQDKLAGRAIAVGLFAVCVSTQSTEQLPTPAASAEHSPSVKSILAKNPTLIERDPEYVLSLQMN
jgi:hypothetical protein